MKGVRFVALVLAVSIGAAAVSQAALGQAKTREQVRAELAQAQHDGMTPVSNLHYPPTADATARQKALHAMTKHAGEKSPKFDQHDTIAKR